MPARDQRAYMREYYKKNREKKLAYSRQYNEENREKKLAYNRRYHENNREKMNAYCREYSRAQRATGGTGVYVVTHPKHESVKIGSTSSFIHRLVQYNTGCPDYAYQMPVTVHTSERRRVERETRELLAEYRIGKTEWFRCTVEQAACTIRRAVGPIPGVDIDYDDPSVLFLNLHKPTALDKPQIHEILSS